MYRSLIGMWGRGLDWKVIGEISIFHRSARMANYTFISRISPIHMGVVSTCLNINRLRSEHVSPSLTVCVRSCSFGIILLLPNGILLKIAYSYNFVVFSRSLKNNAQCLFDLFLVCCIISAIL